MTPKVRLLLAGIGIVVFAAVIWFLVLSPIRGDIADTDQAIQDEEILVAQANTQLKQAEATRAEGKRNQMRLLELAKMVPMTEELPSLLLQIQDLADQSGIEFIQVTPGEVTASESAIAVQAIPLQLEFTGTYFDVSDFIYRAEQMVAGPGRLLSIQSVDMGFGSAGEEGGITAGKSPELKVSMSIYAFIVGGGTAGAGAVVPPASSDENTGSSAADTEASDEQ
jgi:Tfp pilus assembly protein PilO